MPEPFFFPTFFPPVISIYRFLLPSSSVWLLRSRGGIDWPGPTWLVCSEQHDFLVLTGVTCDLKKKQPKHSQVISTLLCFCMALHTTDSIVCLFVLVLLIFIDCQQHNVVQGQSWNVFTYSPFYHLTVTQVKNKDKTSTLISDDVKHPTNDWNSPMSANNVTFADHIYNYIDDCTSYKFYQNEHLDGNWHATNKSYEKVFWLVTYYQFN